MKKLNLEMLRLTSADVLERSQMKKITGGYGARTFSCHCIGSVGAWSGTYSGWGSAMQAVQYWCASGSGTCK
jgi:natural product precursor